MFRSAWVVGFLLAISACAADVKEDLAPLAVSTRCCDDPITYKPTILPANREERVFVSSEDPVFAFPSGRSYFKSFALPPARGEDSRIYVRSIESSAGAFSKRYLIPAVAFLTDERKVLSDSDSRIDRCEHSSCAGLLYSSQIPNEAKTAIIYTDTGAVGEKRIDVIGPANLTLVVGYSVIRTTSWRDATRTGYRAATGEIRVWVTP